ncbi:MAG TPA: hypothetical protein VKG43_04290 [Acidimicrobiales bacterium]|nr:hypothetical protein [Acidimicrobiales bacterium]
MSPEDRFAELVDAFAGQPAVSAPGEGRGFGSAALRVQGKIFAMLAGGRLVVKLPEARVDELVGAGEGRRFDANKAKPMKEWLSVDPTSALPWPALAQEARAHVADASLGRTAERPSAGLTPRTRTGRGSSLGA